MNKPIWESSITRAKSSQSRLVTKLNQRFKSSFSKTQDKRKLIDFENHSKNFVFETQKAQNRLEANLNFKTFDGLSDRSFNSPDKDYLEKFYDEQGIEDMSRFVIHTFARPKGLVAVKGKQTRKFCYVQETPRQMVRLGMTGVKLVKGKGKGMIKNRVRVRDKFLEIVSVRVLDKK